MAGSKSRARKPKLTAALVANVKTPDKYFDDRRMGLFLLVKEDGRKSWVQRVSYRGKRHDLGLGVPPVVTLKMARELALENKRMIAAGLDPKVERQKERLSLTFAEAVDRYLEHKLREFRNEKHRKQWRATLDSYALPIIGNQPIDIIGLPDVLRVLEPIWTTKT